jgi:hypothetical protein
MNYPQDRVQTYLYGLIFFVLAAFVIQIPLFLVFGIIGDLIHFSIKTEKIIILSCSISFAISMWGFKSFPEYSSNQLSVWNQLLNHRYGSGIWWFPPYVTEIYSRVDVRPKEMVASYIGFTKDGLLAGLSAHFFFPIGNHRKLLDVGFEQFEKWVKANLTSLLKGFIAERGFRELNSVSKISIERSFLEKLKRRFDIEIEDLEMDILALSLNENTQRNAFIAVAASVLQFEAFENKAKALQALQKVMPNASPEVLANSFRLVDGHIQVDQRVLQHMGTFAPPGIVVDVDRN